MYLVSRKQENKNENMPTEKKQQAAGLLFFGEVLPGNREEKEHGVAPFFGLNICVKGMGTDWSWH
ncbi:hypothetical protein J2X83_005559 [Brevibacillus nitrificans]|nr:hypothetical protein [Brevibacillus nitrificans]